MKPWKALKFIKSTSLVSNPNFVKLDIGGFGMRMTIHVYAK